MHNERLVHNKRLRYLLAILFTAGGALIRVPFADLLGKGLPFLTFFPAVTASAFYLGFKPAIVTTILSALLANYFYVVPLNTISYSPQYLVQSTLFILECLWIGWICSRLNRTINTLENREKDLIETTRIAEEASAAKDRFLSTLSHELRTPLTPVLALLQAVDDPATLDKKDFQLYFDIMKRNIEQEVHLIDDMLDLTRIINSKLRLTKEFISARTIVRHAVETSLPLAMEKHIEISEKNLLEDDTVHWDPNRLRQVVSNLLINAVKYTPDGGKITIALKEGPNKEKRIIVTDTGIGIQQEDLEKIFYPFEQTARTTVNGHGGLGLGLAISRQLAQMHNATLTAHSDGIGKGSSFILTIPQHADQ